MRINKRISGILLCLLLLTSCTPAEPGPSNSPGTASPANTASGSEAQPTKAPNYLSDPKFDTKDPLPQYDHDNTWAHRSKPYYATADTLYLWGGTHGRSFLNYVDLVTGISGPLCGKPECSHTDSQCSAYAINPTGLSLYAGKLYWLGYDENGDPAIFCVNPDGAGRVKVCSLDRARDQEIVGDRRIIFHRGYAILFGSRGSVVNGVVQRGSIIYVVSLATGEEAVILDQTFGGETVTSIKAVPYRDTLYLIYTESTDGQLRMDISAWSLKTHETTLLYSQTTELIPEGIWPTEGGFLISDASGSGIYKFVPDTGKITLAFDFCTEEEGYYGATFANGYTIGWTLSEERIPHIRATDLEGNEVYSEELGLPDWPSQGLGYGLMGADDGNLYVQLDWKGGKTTAVQIPLDGAGTVRELWSRERPLG